MLSDDWECVYKHLLVLSRNHHRSKHLFITNTIFFDGGNPTWSSELVKWKFEKFKKFDDKCDQLTVNVDLVCTTCMWYSL